MSRCIKCEEKQRQHKLANLLTTKQSFIARLMLIDKEIQKLTDGNHPEFDLK